MPAGRRRTGRAIEVVNFYNPQRRAPVNTVPGLVGVILTMTMVLFTAIALVRERERGNLEMLIATPVSPWELTIGKVLPFVGIGLVQVTIVLLLGTLLFDVPVRGSLLELYRVALVFIVASLSLGVFLSTLAKTQFQAMQMAFFTFLPQILLSGFMFPYAGMPVAGAVSGGDPAAHAFPAPDPRHHAARRGRRRAVAFDSPRSACSSSSC